MPYEIKEPWRQLQIEDEEDLSGIKEGFIEKLVDGRSLLYLREGSRPKFSGDLCSYYLCKFSGKVESDLIAQLVEGKVAMHPSSDIQFAHLRTANTTRYLSIIADGLDGLVSHFEKVPAQNEFYHREIETIKKINDVSEGLKRGELSNKDEAFIFWML